MQLHGIHHVTAISAKIGQNARFYTQALGLRLVKKSVNQDDTSAYHLFYADRAGTPGTDMTFFDWPSIPQERRGTDSIVGTAFRVNGAAALAYWQARLPEYNARLQPMTSFDGRDVLPFEDPEGQRLLLVDDGGAPTEAQPWDGAGVPPEHAVRGFYAVVLSVPRMDYADAVLTQALHFTRARTATFGNGQAAAIFTMGAGAPGQQVWVLEEKQAAPAYSGAGGVHHVAFRVRDGVEQEAWRAYLRRVGVPVSSLIDRYYFQSIYFRISNGILFEIATDGPGFAADEPLETLGERLALPPFLEPRRAQIEARLKPIS
jgi:glyoxalase family protein